VKAFVVCRGEPLTTARVLGHCRTRLEDFMLPREVEFLKALPKNASGKIDKLALISQSERATEVSVPNTLSPTAGEHGPCLNQPADYVL